MGPALFQEGANREMRYSEIRRLKHALEQEAAEAGKDPQSVAWMEPEQWKEYMGGGIHWELYNSFSDGELLSILQQAAAELGRNPSKKEVFCVYRVFLIKRFGNWPKALVAAGLKPPRAQRRAANRLRNLQAEIQRHVRR